MSKYVNMLGWNDATSAVYADLLSDPTRFEKAIAAGTLPFKGKRPGWFKRTACIQKAVSEGITKSIASPLAARLVDAGLKDVKWMSLTRRLINQGKIDIQFYTALAARYTPPIKSTV